MNTEKSLWSFVTAPAPRYMLRLKALKDVFDKYLSNQSFSFIEIGPGLGDLCAYLLSLSNAQKGCAVDFSEASVRLLKTRFASAKNFSIYHGNVSEFKNKQAYDVMLVLEVLEHIEDDCAFLQQTREFLSDNGLLILSVPAYKKLWQKQDVYAGHVRRYEKTELIEKITHEGYEICEVLDYGFPLMRLLKPVKEFYYRSPPVADKEQLTKKSGVDRAIYRGKNVQLNFVLLYPFMVLQKWFRRASLGDGLIVVARKK